MEVNKLTRLLSPYVDLGRGLWRGHLSEARCISILGPHAVTLIGRFLESGEQFELEASVRWPGLSFARRRLVCVRLLSDSPAACQLTQIPRWWTTEFRVCLPAQAVAACNGVLRFEVSEQSQERVSGVLEVEVLDRARTERLLLESLQTTKPRLWVHSGGACHPADTLAHSDDFLVPEFSLRHSELCAFVPVPESTLTLSLAAGNQRIPLSRKVVQLGAEDCLVRWPSISLQDPRLFPAPGPYRLVASVADRDLAVLRFSIAGEQQCLQQVRVARIQFQAETREGQLVRGLTTVSWEEHRAFQPVLTLETALSAPNLLVCCTARTCQGDLPLWQEEFVLPLNRVSRSVRLQRIELGGNGLHAQPKPIRLTISVEIAGGQKAAATLVILPAERIANFEGALKLNVEDLPYEESEYEQIIRSLGVPRPASERWRFWRHLLHRTANRPPPSVED